MSEINHPFLDKYFKYHTKMMQNSICKKYIKVVS